MIARRVPHTTGRVRLAASALPTTDVVASVIIPAYNEGQVLADTLKRLTSTMRPGEFEVLVVCNGCTDDTPDIARRFAPAVRVIETPIGSKIRALNLGDQHAQHFPRVYLDADIQLDAEAIRAVAEQLEDSDILAAAPRLEWDFSRSSWAVRHFYRIWNRMPYWQSRPIGTGVYALSRAGREMFDRFPSIVADDEFVNRLVGPDRRAIIDDHVFETRPAETIDALIRIRARHHSGAAELLRAYPQIDREHYESRSRALLRMMRNPVNWLGVLVYVYVTVMSKRAVRRKPDQGHSAMAWERDSAVRAGAHVTDTPKPQVVTPVLDDDSGVFAHTSRKAEPRTDRATDRHDYLREQHRASGAATESGER